MLKKWKDIKVGDVMKDGSTVTQIHRTHNELCCKVTYDNDKEIICSYTHIFLIDISNLPKEGKDELNQFCTFVPLEENYEILCDDELTINEKLVIEQFCHNENIPINVNFITSNEESETYDFYFENKIKRIILKSVTIKSEPQKVDENTYWLTCKGIDYLMKKYNVNLYCNNNIINRIDIIGELPCFCISTNTGKYET